MSFPVRLSAFALAAGFAATAGVPVTADAQDTRIRFSLDWKFEGPSAPFLAALERGYYAEEGLNVTIDSGQGSRESIPRVATGTYQMGSGDLNSVIKFRDQNPDIDVKGVFIVYDAPPFAIVGRESLGVSEPADLEGKTLGAPAPDAAYAQWPIFVEETGIDADAVTIENVGFPVREPMLASGQVHAITGYSFSSFINLKAQGTPESDISVMLMSDYGVDLYGNAVIVNPSFAADNPEAVEGFVRATVRGFADTIEDPGGVIDYVLDRNDVAKRDVELERLMMALEDNIVTDYVRENGVGGIDEERLSNSIDQIGLAYDYSNKPSADEVFTTEYLPPAEERMMPSM